MTGVALVVNRGVLSAQGAFVAVKEMTTRFSDKDWAEATGSAGPGGSMGFARPMRNPVTRQVLRPFATKAAPQPKLDRKQAKAELARERRRLLALMLALDLECRRLPKGLLLGVAAGGREAEKRHAASRSRNSMEVHLSPASRIVVNEARMAAKREHSLKTVRRDRCALSHGRIA